MWKLLVVGMHMIAAIRPDEESAFIAMVNRKNTETRLNLARADAANHTVTLSLDWMLASLNSSELLRATALRMLGLEEAAVHLLEKSGVHLHDVLHGRFDFLDDNGDDVLSLEEIDAQQIDARGNLVEVALVNSDAAEDKPRPRRAKKKWPLVCFF